MDFEELYMNYFNEIREQCEFLPSKKIFSLGKKKIKKTLKKMINERDKINNYNADLIDCITDNAADLQDTSKYCLSLSITLSNEQAYIITIYKELLQTLDNILVNYYDETKPYNIEEIIKLYALICVVDYTFLSDIKEYNRELENPLNTTEIVIIDNVFTLSKFIFMKLNYNKFNLESVQNNLEKIKQIQLKNKNVEDNN